NGVAVGDIDSAARSRFNIPDNVRGALITDVDPDSVSYEAGLRPGDVIQEIDHKRVTNAEEAVEVSKNVKTKQVLVRLWSRGGSHYVVVDEGKSR
ncbi:MAG: PDZ domain-containing protein, partial [Verrucomicrobia bacterium]